LRRITHQRMTIDAFLDGAPSVEKALDKLFLKFGEDEEEDAALLKVARLYLKERAEKEQREALLEAARRLRSRPIVTQATPEPEPPEEPPTEEDIRRVRNFDNLYDLWMIDGTGYIFRRQYEELAAELRNTSDPTRRAELQNRLAEMYAFQYHMENGNIVDYYEGLIEDVFGYDIRIGDAFLNDVEASIGMLSTLNEASLAILDYFDNIITEGGILEAAEAFRTFFGRNPDNTQIIVRLGADDDDEAGEPEYGFVPLNTECLEGDDECLEEQRTIYLGSEVNVATIVHEFGHQLDRWFRLSGFLSSQNLDWTQLSDLLRDGTADLPPIQADEGARLSLDDTYRYGIQGFAAKQWNDGEIWADLFMTAVLAGSTPTTCGPNSPYCVFTIIDPPPQVLYALVAGGYVSGDTDWICGRIYHFPNYTEYNDGEPFTIMCDYRPVGFRESDFGPQLQEYTNRVIQYLLESG
jgi:hypothetical protein